METIHNYICTVHVIEMPTNSYILQFLHVEQTVESAIYSMTTVAMVTIALVTCHETWMSANMSPRVSLVEWRELSMHASSFSNLTLHTHTHTSPVILDCESNKSCPSLHFRASMHCSQTVSLATALSSSASQNSGSEVRNYAWQHTVHTQASYAPSSSGVYFSELRE